MPIGIKLDLLFCRQGMDHIGHTTYQVDGIEHIDSLGAVGHADGNPVSFADAHGNDLGDLDNLFAEGAMVKVILDTDTNKAFIQNADTNAYLEKKFDNLGIESAEYPGCFHRLAGEEAEWINPPMVAGVEYRTSKRHNGSPVYTKLFHVETLKTPSVAMGIQGRVISFHGNAFHASGSVDPFPMFDGAGSLMAIAYIAQGSIQIRAFNDKDISNYSASFIIEYTK